MPMPLQRGGPSGGLTATCVYCQATKPTSDFNREHVIPESFGTFGPETYVLRHQVCRACNQHFGDTLDRCLARDSPEGLERYSIGAATLKEHLRVGGGRLQLRHNGGFLDGAIVEFGPSDDATELVAHLLPQLGFSREREGPVHWVRADPLPSVDDLPSTRFQKGETYFVRTVGMPPERGADILRKLGIASNSQEIVPPEPMGEEVELTARAPLDDTHTRGIAKIAFNYLAFHFPDIASMPQFDAIRRYVRYGDKLDFTAVIATNHKVLGQVDEATQLLAHAITAHWVPGLNSLVAQVSLYTWATYQVRLSALPFPALPPLIVDSGHLFDPFNRRILPLSRHVPVYERGPLPLTKLERRR